MTAHRVILVGLGEIGGTHLRVLEQTADAEVIAAVDTSDQVGGEFRGQPIPVYPGVAAAAQEHQADIVIVATPTATHAEVCDQVADAFPHARILIEKPAADTLAGAHHVIEGIGARQPVDIAYHMSFSPEVAWGLNYSRAWAAELGHVAAITASFTDPYSAKAESARARFGSSWIDSGINALSILNKFTTLTGRLSLRQVGDPAWSAFEARLTCTANANPAEALILTSWHVSDAAKTTTIQYDTGAVLVMDHTAVAGYVIRGHRVSDIFGTDTTVPRRERHYQAMYQHWLIEGQPMASPQVHLLLHDLLLRPT
jgi:predicted dehydrogenase